MKKLFTILVVAAFVFAACGQKKAETEVLDTTAVVEEVIEVQDDTAAEVVEEMPAETPAE